MPTTSEDRDEIRELYARYCLAFDQGDGAGWAACYTEGGEFIGAGHHLRGRAAMEEFLSASPVSSSHRITCNHIIDLDGDRARCRSSVVLLSEGAIVGSGRAVDELERVGGSWKIAHRAYTPDRRGEGGSAE